MLEFLLVLLCTNGLANAGLGQNKTQEHPKGNPPGFIQYDQLAQAVDKLINGMMNVNNELQKLQSMFMEKNADMQKMNSSIQTLQAKVQKQNADIQNIAVDMTKSQCQSGIFSLKPSYTLPGSNRQDRRTIPIQFPRRFKNTPAVTLGVTGLDYDFKTNIRLQCAVHNITSSGFDAYCRVWEDTNMNYVALNWMAC